jgi:hypothetical protein
MDWFGFQVRELRGPVPFRNQHVRDGTTKSVKIRANGHAADQHQADGVARCRARTVHERQWK